MPGKTRSLIFSMLSFFDEQEAQSGESGRKEKNDSDNEFQEHLSKPQEVVKILSFKFQNYY